MSFKIDEIGNLIWTNEKGEYHREKGPAILGSEGHIIYYFNGRSHRLDGPAVIWSNAIKEYWIHGEPYNKEKYWTERLKCYELKY